MQEVKFKNRRLLVTRLKADADARLEQVRKRDNEIIGTVGMYVGRMYCI